MNALLEKEVEKLVNAKKYDRSSELQGYHSRYYKRNLHTTVGEIELKVPKLKGVPFETAIIELYCCRESSVIESMSKITIWIYPLCFPIIKNNTLL